MRLNALFLFVLAFPFFLCASNTFNGDSLLQVWKTPGVSAKVRIKALNSYLSPQFLKEQPDEAWKLTQQLQALAEKENSPVYLGRAQYFFAEISQIKYESSEAVNYYQKALEIWQASGDTSQGVQAYMGLGAAHYHLGNLVQAEENYLKALDLLYTQKDTLNAVDVIMDLGSIYKYKGNTLKAVQHNQLALKLCLATPACQKEFPIRNNLAGSFVGIEDFPRAIEQVELIRASSRAKEDPKLFIILNKNLAALQADIGEFAKAKHSLDLAMKMAQDSQMVQAQAFVHMGYGNYHMLREAYAQALTSFETSYAIIQEHSFGRMRINAMTKLAKALVKLDRLEEANTYLTQALSEANAKGQKGMLPQIHIQLVNLLMEQGKWKEAQQFALDGFALAEFSKQVRNQADLANQLVEIYKHFGNSDEALRLLEIEDQLQDSMFSKENRRAYFQLEYEYYYKRQAYQDSLKNVAALAIKEEENIRRKNTANFLLGGLVLTFIFGLVLWSRFRITRRQKQVIEEEKIKLSQAYADLDAEKLKLDQAYTELNRANEKL
ncbi:MAG: tetratricopeptide repeat protein, partial [Bacteroidota bacterium]